jgi:hypothetical protein
MGADVGCRVPPTSSTAETETPPAATALRAATTRPTAEASRSRWTATIPSMTLADTQQQRLLERLRHAGHQPVAFVELHADGIDFLAAVVLELELSGYAIERVYDHDCGSSTVSRSYRARGDRGRPATRARRRAPRAARRQLQLPRDRLLSPAAGVIVPRRGGAGASCRRRARTCRRSLLSGSRLGL